MKSKYIKLILFIVLVSFLCSYVLANNGYYEESLRKKTVITSEKMKEFEEALKEDKDISDISSFNESNINYTNRFSELVYNINDKGNNLFKKYLRRILKNIGKYMLEE